MSSESFGKVGRTYPSLAAASDHGSARIGRRVFLKRMIDGLIVFSALASGYYEERHYQYDVDRDNDRERFDLLDKLIGRNGERVSIGTVPAVNHPNVRRVKNYFSESGERVSRSYALALQEANCPIRKAAGAIGLRKEDTAVVIGSRLANTFAEHYLGSANKSPDKGFRIKDARGAHAQPKWTFYSDPSAPAVEVVQWGKSWLSRNNLIVECRNGRTYTAAEQLHAKTEKKYREGDYLLLQVLPRYNAGDPQRVVIFEGLHRNGTLAAGLLCSNPPVEDLRRINKAVGADSYYQALFRVRTRVDEQGEAIPIGIELHDDPYPLTFN